MINRVVEQLAARRAHNPEVAGSSPARATITPCAWTVCRALSVKRRTKSWSGVGHCGAERVGAMTSLAAATQPCPATPCRAFLFAAGRPAKSAHSSPSTLKPCGLPGRFAALGIFLVG